MAKSAAQTIEAAIVAAWRTPALRTMFENATVERYKSGWNVVVRYHRYGFRYAGGAVAWLEYLVKAEKFHAPTKAQSESRGTRPISKLATLMSMPIIEEPPVNEEDTAIVPLDPLTPTPDLLDPQDVQAELNRQDAAAERLHIEHEQLQDAANTAWDAVHDATDSATWNAAYDRAYLARVALIHFEIVQGLLSVVPDRKQ